MLTNKLLFFTLAKKIVCSLCRKPQIAVASLYCFPCFVLTCHVLLFLMFMLPLSSTSNHILYLVSVCYMCNHDQLFVCIRSVVYGLLLHQTRNLIHFFVFYAKEHALERTECARSVVHRGFLYLPPFVFLVCTRLPSLMSEPCLPQQITLPVLSTWIRIKDLHPALASCFLVSVTITPTPHR